MSHRSKLSTENYNITETERAADMNVSGVQTRLCGDPVLNCLRVQVRLFSSICPMKTLDQAIIP